MADNAVMRGPDPGEHAGGVTVRYWAGARDAAGVAEEQLEAGPGAGGEAGAGPLTVADLLDRLTAAHPQLGPVLPVCSVLVDGLASQRTSTVPDGATVEVLPPFAGG